MRAHFLNGSWDGSWSASLRDAWPGTLNGSWNGSWDGSWDGPWHPPRGAQNASLARALLREGVISPADVAASPRPAPAFRAQGPGRWRRWTPDVLVTLVLAQWGLELRVGLETGPDRAQLQDWRSGGPNVRHEVLARPQSDFTAQLDQVMAQAALREERAAEIMMQAQGLDSSFAAMLPMPPQQLYWTWALLQMVSTLCTRTVMPIKHAFGHWRPSELSPQVQPLIDVPGHATYPAGHAVQAHAAATVLKALWSWMPVDERQRLDTLADRTAERIGANRVVAGLHFPIDIEAGAPLGTAIANWVIDGSPLRSAVGAGSALDEAAVTALLADGRNHSLSSQLVVLALAEWCSAWQGWSA